MFPARRLAAAWRRCGTMDAVTCSHGRGLLERMPSPRSRSTTARPTSCHRRRSPRSTTRSTRPNATVCVVVLTGRPGLLSAGFDLKMLAAQGDDALAMLRGGFELSARSARSIRNRWSIACSGHAVAMGAFLLLSGDYLIGVAGRLPADRQRSRDRDDPAPFGARDHASPADACRVHAGRGCWPRCSRPESAIRSGCSIRSSPLTS